MKERKPIHYKEDIDVSISDFVKIEEFEFKKEDWPVGSERCIIKAKLDDELTDSIFKNYEESKYLCSKRFKNGI